MYIKFSILGLQNLGGLILKKVKFIRKERKILDHIYNCLKYISNISYSNNSFI